MTRRLFNLAALLAPLLPWRKKTPIPWLDIRQLPGCVGFEAYGCHVTPDGWTGSVSTHMEDSTTDVYVDGFLAQTIPTPQGWQKVGISHCYFENLPGFTLQSLYQ